MALQQFVESKTFAEIHSSDLLVSALVFLEQNFNIPIQADLDQEVRRNSRKPWKDKGLLADVAIWQKVYQALQQLNRLGRWTYPSPIYHPALALMVLANEGYIIGAYARGADDVTTSKEWVERYRKNTQALSKNRNPFPKESFTHLFAQSCLDVVAFRTASKSAGSAFLDNFVTPLLDARRNYLKVVMGAKPVLIRADTFEPVRSQVKTKRKNQRKSNPGP